MSDLFRLSDTQMTGLAAEHGKEKTVMIDATCLKAHRAATSLAAKKRGQ